MRTSVCCTEAVFHGETAGNGDATCSSAVHFTAMLKAIIPLAASLVVLTATVTCAFTG
ncbi:hypothetical protein GGR88_001024 [Sphingomonas jejuensis]|uniref:Uncharacterized protein n=1 Tax=Sphingomonas jejuensis TaxID=904715 RepID=A0ABX0XJY6_9SPHN|nr:hypothetical protein [Sphingomonas jejuensis]NJC33550.1 hypothetical protein [Sphingomonas jejuensis]